MKTIVISDIHGKTVWKDIVAQEYDKVVFLGDYVDTHGKESPKQQIDNLLEILSYKEEHSEKVILLRGNHCSRYVFGTPDDCSGFQYKVREKFPMNRYKELTQWIYIQDDIIFSHAGISERWMEYCKINDINEINDITDFNKFRFNGGYYDVYGTDPQQTPIWIRPNTLIHYSIPNFTQVVGHTPQEHINCLTTDVDTKLWLTDCLPNEYLIIDEGEFKINHL